MLTFFTIIAADIILGALLIMLGIIGVEAYHEDGTVAPLWVQAIAFLSCCLIGPLFLLYGFIVRK